MQDTQSKGWVKIHRQIYDNPWLRRPAYMAVWVWLICHACYSDTQTSVIWKSKRIWLKKGQLTAGQIQISEDTGVPRGTVHRILKTLENEQQIEQLTSPRFSLITVKNYEKYQFREQPDELPANNQRTTDEQPVNTIKEFKKERKKEEHLSTARKKNPPPTLPVITPDTPAQAGGGGEAKPAKRRSTKADRYKDPTPIDIKAKIKTMLEDTDRRMNIIAFYWVASRQYAHIKTAGVYAHQISRNLRTAGNLTGYDNEQIKETMSYCARQFNDWTLETVEKYITKPKQELSPHLTVV